MYGGVDAEPYMSNIPPRPHFLRELDARGYRVEAALIRQHFPKAYWPENFFRN